MTQKKNQNNDSSLNKVIVHLVGSSTAPVQFDTNLTIHIPQTFQPYAIQPHINTPLATTPVLLLATTTILAVSGMLQLTKKQIKKLKKFNCYFNCKYKSHMTAICIYLIKLYLAISAQLQEVMLLQDNTNNSKKNQPLSMPRLKTKSH